MAKLPLYDKLDVIYEDNHLIAVNKPAGWLVHGDITGDKPMVDYVKQYIKVKYKKPGDVFLGVVHRIDRPVSGSLIFARTTKALTRMNKLFLDGDIQKVYWAITEKRPEPLIGRVEHWLWKDKAKNISRAYLTEPKKREKSKLSLLDYDFKGSISGYNFIEVRPHTGRPHQIRVQLSAIGCPIKGDLKYGAAHANKDASIHLHCHSMTFIHPVKKEQITIKCKPDKKDQIWRLFKGNLFR